MYMECKSQPPLLELGGQFLMNFSKSEGSPILCKSQPPVLELGGQFLMNFSKSEGPPELANSFGTRWKIFDELFQI